MKKIFLFLTALLLIVAGCKESSTVQLPQPPTGAPVINLAIETLNVGAAGGRCSVDFQIENAVDEVPLRAASDCDWIEDVDILLSSVLLTVKENNSEESRSAKLILAYRGAERVELPVVQSGRGGDVVATPTFENLAVKSVNATSAEISFVLNYEGEEALSSVTLFYGVGEDANYSTKSLEPLIGSQVVLLDGLTPQSEYGFYLKAQFESESCESEHKSFTTLAEGSDESYEPTFSDLASSAVTHNSATLSCELSYEGKETISEAGFCYITGGVERKLGVNNALGSKSVTLSNLDSSTTYEWYFYAVVGGERYASERKSFTTSSTPAPVGNVWRTTWPELCVEDDNNSDYYYAHHITDVTMNGQKARNYTVCYSAEHHCPVWVAAPRHSAYEGDTRRSDAYAQDPKISADIQYYSKSTGGGCNKGHMLGSAERTASSLTNRQVFYYTNIAPQYSSGFNTGGGGWNILEDWIDDKVCSDTTYLVIGTHFERYTDGYGVTASPKKIEFGGRDDVSCPTMFYIAVLRTKRGNTGKSVINCSKDELMCAAFVRSHSNEHKGQVVTSREMVSISELEAITGHKFFVNVPNAPKESFNSSDWGL